MPDTHDVGKGDLQINSLGLALSSVCIGIERAVVQDVVADWAYTIALGFGALSVAL